MILELADIRVHSGQQAEFEQAARHGLETVLSKADGFRKYEVRRSVETPERFVPLIHWDTLEDYTIGFRASPAYAQWRAIVGPFFAQPPFVEHFEFCASLSA
ncbi:antibiotic biosynthesis monooxygenase [Variovorax sp. OK605]|jgi:heme-degrading monooxygenase HmoA|uniref:antibiotic biosynthesis monooxygenase family protein n=1 Tax=Variovorax sp. OK605 TaxID=1855317 RepID=UPI000A87EECC|nr:antibiotic biosynthesis monooxygenase [Variovorax sp. OK605]